MNIYYKRTSDKNYMILEGESYTCGYESTMLLENQPPTLLDSHTIEINDDTQFWYDITGKKSLRDFFDQEGVTLENLKTAFFGIREAQQTLAEYLIGESHVYFHVDSIFLDQRNHGQLFLCFCPLSLPPYTEQLQSIMEYIISVVDHHKGNVTKLCYDMYAITEQSHFSLSDLLNILEDESSMDFRPYEPPLQPVCTDQLSDDDVRQVAEKIGEDIFEERENEHHSFLKKIQNCFCKWKEKISSKRNELFPEDEYLRDIEFDEVIPHETAENKTVLLAENTSACCGKLIHDTGGLSEDIFISHTPFRIGSKPGGNDAVLTSSAVSRYHAKIIRKDGIFYLEDLNSTNGTFLNGKILNYHESVPLKSMDTISFGDMMYHII